MMFSAGMNLTNMSKCLKCADKDDIITMKVWTDPCLLPLPEIL